MGSQNFELLCLSPVTIAQETISPGWLRPGCMGPFPSQTLDS